MPSIFSRNKKKDSASNSSKHTPQSPSHSSSTHKSSLELAGNSPTSPLKNGSGNGSSGPRRANSHRSTTSPLQQSAKRATTPPESMLPRLSNSHLASQLAGQPAGQEHRSPSGSQLPVRPSPGSSPNSKFGASKLTATHPTYPWSKETIQNVSPFPRYGHAANYIAAKEGEVFIMGGLRNSTVFGDLWVVETDTLTGYLVETQGCPSPRVGHAALTLGNAFIVFGGDTKIEPTDILDDNLYLLNTETCNWTVANPQGQRPSGRYGHSLSTISSKVYIFGGQFEDYFFDDLWVYDLTTLRSPTSRWELIDTPNKSPPPRTNHTVVTFNDKLYLFGGTNGKLWFSDTWCYDPVENTWTLLNCTGFIPAPCEGHAATIIGDTMYVLGGRTSQGKDVAYLSALKLTTQKWFTFQNLGPGPLARSGHSLTAFERTKILVMGGESSKAIQEDEDDPSTTVYVLDTSRINYPPQDTQAAVQNYSGLKTAVAHQSPNGQSQIRTIGSPSSANGAPFQKSASDAAGSPTQSYPTEGVAENSPLYYTHPKELNGAAPINQVYPSTKMSSNSNGHGFDSSAAGDVAEASEETDETNSMPDRALGSTPTLGHITTATAGAGTLAEVPHSAATSNYSSLNGGSDKQLHSSVLPNEKGNFQAEKSASENAGSIEDDSTSSTTFESVDTQNDGDYVSKVPAVSSVANVPGAWASKEDTSTQDADITRTANYEEDGEPDKQQVREVDLSQNHSRVESVDANEISDQSTPRKGMSTAALAGPATLVGISPTNLTSPKSEVTNVSQALERLKASNTWYESELRRAKEAGYVPSTNPPVDVLKMRRVSQQLLHDTPDSLNEREILISALSELKDELQMVKDNIREQTEVASAKILSAEQSRDDALHQLELLQKDSSAKSVSAGAAAGAAGGAGARELSNASGDAKIAELESQLAEERNLRQMLLNDSSGEDGLGVEHWKSENFKLENQVREHASNLILCQHEVSRLKAELEAQKSHRSDMDKIMEERIAGLVAASAAVTAAQSKANSLQSLVNELQQQNQELLGTSQQTKSELESTRAQLEAATSQLANNEKLLTSANEQNQHLSGSLKNGIDEIVSLWGASATIVGVRQLANRNSAALANGSRSLNSETPDSDAIASEGYESELADLTKLSESHKAAAEKATQELSAALEQVAALKAQLLKSETEHNKSLQEVESIKGDVNSHQRSLGDLTAKIASLESALSEREASLQTRDVEVRKHEEQLNLLQEMHSKKYSELETEYSKLEDEYNKSFVIFQNNDKALSKTRDEIARLKEANNKLSSELEDMKLHVDDGNQRNSAIGSPKFSSRQFELQLRDLRAQIIILQEERDELREKAQSLKMKAFNAMADLEESRAEVKQLRGES